MSKNIVTLKSRLGVTHPANLCTISIFLKSTVGTIILLLIIWV